MFLRNLILVCSLIFSSIALAAPVNINTAGPDAIAEALNGIGPSKAAAIVQYRADNGPFKSVEELKFVKGIGQKTLDKIKDNIILVSEN